MDPTVKGVSPPGRLVTVACEEVESLRVSLEPERARPLSAFPFFSFCLAFPNPQPKPHPSLRGCGGGGVLARDGTLYDSVSVLNVTPSPFVVMVSEDESELWRVRSAAEPRE